MEAKRGSNKLRNLEIIVAISFLLRTLNQKLQGWIIGILKALHWMLHCVQPCNSSTLFNATCDGS